MDAECPCDGCEARRKAEVEWYYDHMYEDVVLFPDFSHFVCEAAQSLVGRLDMGGRDSPFSDDDWSTSSDFSWCLLACDDWASTTGSDDSELAYIPIACDDVWSTIWTDAEDGRDKWSAIWTDDDHIYYQNYIAPWYDADYDHTPIYGAYHAKKEPHRPKKRRCTMIKTKTARQRKRALHLGAVPDTDRARLRDERSMKTGR